VHQLKKSTNLLLYFEGVIKTKKIKYIFITQIFTVFLFKESEAEPVDDVIQKIRKTPFRADKESSTLEGATTPLQRIL